MDEGGAAVRGRLFRARMRCLSVGIGLGLVVALPAGVAGAQDPSMPWLDPSLSPEQRVSLLLPQMTLEDKVALMTGDPPAAAGTGAYFNAAIRVIVYQRHIRKSCGNRGPEPDREVTEPGAAGIRVTACRCRQARICYPMNGPVHDCHGRSALEREPPRQPVSSRVPV
jgi:hypothetical protein